MKIIEKSLNYVKSVTADTVDSAKFGYLGSCLGSSAILFSLFKDHYNFDVSDTDFLSRDRFVLSDAHASPLYYTLLSLFGFGVSLQDLKEFSKFGSKTPSQPEYRKTDGVEASTGLYGQGLANAVGMAIAEKSLSDRFNAVGFPIIDNYTYCYVSDEDLMEGVSMEACSLAGTLKLSKLIVLYDCNEVTFEGRSLISNKDNIALKFKGMGFNVITVKKGNNYSSCTKAIKKAKKSNKPTLIIFKTIIGEGTEKEGTSEAYDYIFNEDELKEFKKKLKVKDSFYFPTDVREFCMQSTRRGKLFHEKWNQMLAVYATSQPELYKELESYFDKKKFDFEKLIKNSSKWVYGDLCEVNSLILNELGEKLNQVIGGSSDLSQITKAYLNNSADFLVRSKRGRNIHFGVREHAMSAISNGIALYEDFIVFDSTYLAHISYLLPALKMRSIMHLPVISIFSETINGDEGGGNYQRVEQLSQLRAIPNLKVFRPCDRNEVIAAYKSALLENDPTAIVLSNQKEVAIENTSFKDALLGGYILHQSKVNPDVVIYASGSEVALAVDVCKELSKKYNISVVSMPCMEIFEKQSSAYKTKVLQKNAKLKVVIEASNDKSWYKYISENDLVFGFEAYIQSGKGDIVYQKAGFNVKNIAKEIAKKL